MDFDLLILVGQDIVKIEWPMIILSFKHLYFHLNSQLAMSFQIQSIVIFIHRRDKSFDLHIKLDVKKSSKGIMACNIWFKMELSQPFKLAPFGSRSKSL